MVYKKQLWHAEEQEPVILTPQLGYTFHPVGQHLLCLMDLGGRERGEGGREGGEGRKREREEGRGRERGEGGEEERGEGRERERERGGREREGRDRIQ